MALNDVKLAVINADLGTTGPINDQEKAFWDAALTAGGVSTKTGTFKPASGTGILIDQDNNEISLDIDSESTTADIINISAATLTTGNAIDIRDADSLTNGSMINLVSDSASTANRTLVNIVNDNTAANGTVPFSVRQDAPKTAAQILNTNSGTALLIDNDANGNALVIDNESTSSSCFVLQANTLTSGEAISITNADSLTNGSIADFRSNSSSTTARKILNLVNDNTLAVNASCIAMQQDASNAFMEFTGDTGADATSAISTLTTSGAVQGHIQIDVGGTKRWIAFLADPS